MTSEVLPALPVTPPKTIRVTMTETEAILLRNMCQYNATIPRAIYPHKLNRKEDEDVLQALYIALQKAVPFAF